MRLPATLRALELAEDRPLLHAWQLRLTHPMDGRELVFEAAPPADFAVALAAVGLDTPDKPLL
jgi:hypothetical protein